MNTKKLIQAGLLAALGLGGMLTSTLPVEASQTRGGLLGADCAFGFNCVDTWQVECKDSDTHTIKVSLKDTDSPLNTLFMTTVGLSPASIARHIRPGSNIGGFPSFFDRPGASQGRMKALVLVSDKFSHASNYAITFSCLDISDLEVNDPVVKSVQSKQP